jgi:hypothetical protein
VVRKNANRKFPSAKELGIDFEDLSVAELTKAFGKSGAKRGGKYSQRIEWRFNHMHEFHIESHLQKLCTYGLFRETRGTSMFLIQMAPSLDHLFKEFFGNKEVRIRNAASLATAAVVLEGMSKLVPEMPDTISGLPSPSVTVKAVKYYSTMLVWGEAIYAFVGAKSVVEVAKYSLAGLVKRVSGKFHDREVSALVGAALGDFDYDETAHRVWRIRSYGRLEQSFSIGPKILQAMNDVLRRE